MSDKTVYVLGAGFTRAFVASAPLMIDDWGAEELQEKFANFPSATTALENAKSKSEPGKIDLEKLMTRLTGMPYDTSENRHEFALLDAHLIKMITERLKNFEPEAESQDILKRFAKFVLDNGASLVTFNYDDLVDKALWQQNDLRYRPYRWHPDGGYGFYCRRSDATITDISTYMDDSQTLILKLHGSVNWRTRLGEGVARNPAEILHHEPWLTERASPGITIDDPRIEMHLNKTSFIVPPVLAKSALNDQSILKVVWQQAHKKLCEAKKVVFIGYSLPKTDLAARILFEEALSRRPDGICPNIQVVTLLTEQAKRRELRETYRTLFQKISAKQFYFHGAAKWIEQTILK